MVFAPSVIRYDQKTIVTCTDTKMKHFILQQAQPRGPGANDAGFGEFPWQAMVLQESTKSILCGGAIIESNVVVTAAHCVDK